MTPIWRSRLKAALRENALVIAMALLIAFAAVYAARHAVPFIYAEF